MAKRRQPNEPQKEQTARAIGVLCNYLVKLEVVKNLREIAAALIAAGIITPNSTDLNKSYQPEESMSLEKRERILHFIRQTWPIYRAMFWAVSEDIDIWDEPVYYFSRQADNSHTALVKAKGLFRANPEIVCKGQAFYHSDGIVEIETDNPVGRYKSSIIGCYRRLNYQQAPNVGIIGGQYLAVSGSSQANHPITVRPVILLPEYYMQVLQPKIAEHLMSIRNNPDWWRMKNEVWFNIIDELETEYAALTQ
jgi:hypothetical protein